MCNICYAQKNKISVISANPSTMCDNHYQEALGENWYV